MNTVKYYTDPWYRLEVWWCSVRQLLCRHHEEVLHFEGRRVMMRCLACGRDSPGWDTKSYPRGAHKPLLHQREG